MNLYLLDRIENPHPHRLHPVIERRSKENGEERVARFSNCEKYRYLLSVVWDESLPQVQFIGLNPSTADEMKDDPTLRRVKGFARAWNMGGVMMTNLFAWRDTSPATMKKQLNPIGESGLFLTVAGFEFSNANDLELYTTRIRCAVAIAAWGTHGSHLYRAAKVKQFITNLSCLRLTKQGHPEHPLYLPKNLTPITLM